MKKSSITIYLLTFVISAATAWAYHVPIDVSVQSRGIVRPEGGVVRVISEFGGRIIHVQAQEGAEIHRNDCIVQLDTTEHELDQRMIEQRIHFTKLRVEQLRANLREASAVDSRTLELDKFQDNAARRLSEINLEQTRARLVQTHQLFNEGLISRQAYDDAQHSMDRAQAELDKWNRESMQVKEAQAQARLHERGIEIDSINADLENLYLDLEQSRLKMTRFTITSPVDGIISSLNALHTGEVLAAGATIAMILPENRRILIEGWLPASERRWIQVGQTTRIQPEENGADASHTFDGTVTSIGPDARLTESSATYRILIAPSAESRLLQPGMTFRLHFVTRQERLLLFLVQQLRAVIEA